MTTNSQQNTGPAPVKRYYQWDHLVSDMDRTYRELPFLCVENYDLIIAPTRGGLIPATMLSHQYNVPVLAVNYSTRDFENDEMAATLNEKNLAGKRVLIVDDIWDSGITMVNLQKAVEPFAESFTGLVIFSNKVLTEADNCVTIHDNSEKQLWVKFPWEM